MPRIVRVKVPYWAESPLRAEQLQNASVNYEIDFEQPPNRIMRIVGGVAVDLSEWANRGTPGDWEFKLVKFKVGHRTYYVYGSMWGNIRDAAAMARDNGSTLVKLYPA